MPLGLPCSAVVANCGGRSRSERQYLLQSANTGRFRNAANKATKVAIQVTPIKRKTLTTRTSGLNTTTIETNPAAQKYFFDRTAHGTKMIALRQITAFTR